MKLNLPALAFIANITIVPQPNNPNQYIVRECVESPKGGFCRQTKVEMRENIAEVLKEELKASQNKTLPPTATTDPLTPPNKQPPSPPVKQDPVILRKEDEVVEVN